MLFFTYNAHAKIVKFNTIVKFMPMSNYRIVKMVFINKIKVYKRTFKSGPNDRIWAGNPGCGLRDILPHTRPTGPIYIYFYYYLSLFTLVLLNFELYNNLFLNF